MLERAVRRGRFICAPEPAIDFANSTRFRAALREQTGENTGYLISKRSFESEGREVLIPGLLNDIIGVDIRVFVSLREFVKRGEEGGE